MDVPEKHIELSALELSDLVEGLNSTMNVEEQRGLKKAGRYRRTKRLGVKVAQFAASANLGFQWPNTVLVLEQDWHNLVKYVEYLEEHYMIALNAHNALVTSDQGKANEELQIVQTAGGEPEEGASRLA